MNDNLLKGKIIIFSCLLFALMTIHIVGIFEAANTQVQHQNHTIAAFNG